MFHMQPLFVKGGNGAWHRVEHCDSAAMAKAGKPLPDFAVIGAMRAGTSTLHDMLDAQPGLSLPAMKETDYFLFSKNHDRGAGWYRQRFSSLSLCCGDVSPNYAKRDVFPEAPQLLQEANPQAKIIYLLRDPVERALSQYRHHILLGGELAPGDLLTSGEGRHIIATSRYEWQLEPWRALFDDGSILLICLEDLVASPDETLARIGTFLGVDITGHGAISEANSSDTLSRLPGWWAGLRETPLGLALRSALPRALAERLKRSVSAKTSHRTVPKVPGSIIDDIRETLAPDTAALRQSTGLPFDQWSI